VVCRLRHQADQLEGGLHRDQCYDNEETGLELALEGMERLSSDDEGMEDIGDDGMPSYLDP